MLNSPPTLIPTRDQAWIQGLAATATAVLISGDVNGLLWGVPTNPSTLVLAAGLLAVVWGLADSTPTRPRDTPVTEKDRQHWSFLPLRSPAPPSVKNERLARTPIDRFVLAALEAKNLDYAPPASARILARRIHFGLTGLPPSPEQVEAFVREHERDGASAVAKLVDDLLAGDHYGEKWARHWLDVARYADSDGQESDADRPTAYHYRDFVIRALNRDMPFDEFARWQLAGDEIEPDNPEAVAATGFLVAGTHADLSAVPMEEEKIRERFNELDDMIATTGSAMLGLTLVCARCHDHKYDPLPQADYYRLLRAFNGGDRAEVPLAPLAEARRHREAEAQWKADLEAARRTIEELGKPHAEKVRLAKIDALKIDAEAKALLKSQPDSPAAKDIARKRAKELRAERKDYLPFLTESEKARWDVLEAERVAVEKAKPKPLPMAYAFADFGPEPRETWFFNRGDFKLKREPVELGFLTVLTGVKSPADYWRSAKNQAKRTDTTYQRRALAEWMTDVEHGAGALLARVIVNRVWQHHFGEGLVRTVSDFGARGDPPTHPDLLEWLASEFVKGGWKLKPLHRLIMTSAVYQQGSSASHEADPDNRLLSRKRPRRLDSEGLRDSVLAVSGRLNPQMFGPAFKAPIVSEAIQARNMKNPYPKDLQDTPDTHRRSIYMFHKRVVPSPLMQAFDGPDALASCGRRIPTTVAPQALALLNDGFIRARAADFAERLAKEGDDPSAQVERAWRLALARLPSDKERASALSFITRQTAQRDGADARRLALTDFCQAVFAMNEFVYVD